MPSRRDLLRSSLGAAALIGLRPLHALAGLAADRSVAVAQDRRYRDAALRAERWIRAARITDGGAVCWPADPHDANTVSADLYSGTPGVVLFYLELYDATKERAHLDEARAGADWIVARLGEAAGATQGALAGSGLYEGVAGLAWVLGEVARASGTDGARYRDAARRALRLVLDRATPAGGGAAWGDSTDIISGTAGTGLVLLQAARIAEDDALGAAARETAARAGRRLIELGQPASGGLKWAAGATVPLLYPNFSHGTAGVSYFLAQLHRATGDPASISAALAGARYLQNVARTDDDRCLVFHHESADGSSTDGKELYYLGWCHGPVGTARLFLALAQATHDGRWRDWMRRGARGITTSGIPEARTAGFWNNVSQCCGDTGVAQFFLDLHRLTGRRADLDFSMRVTADLMGRATDDEAGLRWVQAEHRVRPDFLVAQTGYMQGAAGMGSWLLRLDGFLNGRKPFVVWPDSPFA